MSELITVNPKEKQKGFFSENLLINRLPLDHKSTFEKIKKIKITENDYIIKKYVLAYESYFKNKNNNEIIPGDIDRIELEKLEGENLKRYLEYRYKYKIYPNEKILEDYPPCVQVEPTSICNYRCVMCYQKDRTFSKKSSGHMGNMKLELFKKIVDELEGNVEAITLASRGEPMLNLEIIDMLNYCSNKFLALKMNTNGSMLNEKKIHKILSSNLNTIVFSVDSADKENYEKIRVNGNFEKVYSNIKLFSEIKNKHYSDSDIIIRISGVKINNIQNIDSMKDQWQEYADILAFTNYTPWQSSYENEINKISSPCSELWRRMFLWWDGKINPCDFDYKTVLKTGDFDIKKSHNIKKAWNSEIYNNLRTKHLENSRKKVNPCNKCIMI